MRKTSSSWFVYGVASLLLACRTSPTIPPPVKNNSTTMAAASAPTADEPHKLKGLTEVRLENGLMVYLYELREVPLVSLRLVAPAGSAYDTPEKSGLAHLTTRLLVAGNKDGLALREFVDLLGATLSARSFVDDAVLGIDGLSRDFPELLQLLSDIAMRPALTPEGFAQEKRLLLIETSDALQDFEEVANNAARAALFGAHSYGLPPLGAVEAIKTLSLEDVKRFYQRQYSPKTASLVVVGDFETKKILPILQQKLSSWQGEPLSQELVPPSKPKPGRHILLVNAGGDSVEIRVCAPMISVKDPDAPVLDVVNDSLGGGFSSRLLDELRVNLGVTYDVASVLETYQEGGWMAVQTSTSAKNTRIAVDAILKSLAEHRAIGPTKEDLEGAKAFFAVDTARLFEAPVSFAESIAQSIGSGAGPDSLAEYPYRIDAITRQSAAAALLKHFPTGKDDVLIVVVGPAEQTKKLLSGLGDSKVVSLKDHLKGSP
jgi:zinc protease